MNIQFSIDKALPERWLQVVLIPLFCGLFSMSRAQVIDEDLPQITSFGQIGADGTDFMAQSFYADIWQVIQIGVWLQRDSLGGEVKFALVADDQGLPDLGSVLYESPLVSPSDSGQFYFSDAFINLLIPGTRYWVLIDGHENLLATGTSTAGVSNQLTDTGAGLIFSDDAGNTWDSIPGIPLAIFVAGDTCTFTPGFDPIVPLVCPTNPATVATDFGYASYAWSTGETSQEITVTTAGTYSVTVVNTDFCVGLGFVEVIPDVVPNVVLADSNALCEGASVILAVGPFFNQYEWSTGDNTSVIEVDEPGLYWVEALSAGGCAGRDSTLVFSLPAPDINLGEDTLLCQGEVIQFDAGEFDGYNWSTGAVTRSIFVSSDAEVFVTVLDTNSCLFQSDTVEVMVFPRPDSPAVSLDLGNLVSSFGFSYQWFQDGDAVPGAVNQTFENPDSGFYFVEVTNGFGCTSRSDTFFLDIEAPGNFIPSGFSPNGDGVNDVFFVEAIERFPGSQLLVFNRWGEEVYRNDNYQNDWDGRGRGGRDLPDGNYFYILDLGNGEAPRRGNVLINR